MPPAQVIVAVGVEEGPAAKKRFWETAPAGMSAKGMSFAYIAPPVIVAVPTVQAPHTPGAENRRKGPLLVGRVEPMMEA